MVNGFESFRNHFKGYEDCYTIIGGTACGILLREAALPFRSTHDVDMILLIENRFEAFASLFWEYIKAGKYRCGWRGSEQPHFYRFTEPESADYPKIIELFSKRPDFQSNHPEVHLTPLSVSEEVSSLSAIMLDDDYYQLMLNGREIVDGVCVLGAVYLIAFKAKAWLNLAAAKAAGEHVNQRDLRKHKNDVFRLYAIVDPQMRITAAPAIAEDIRTFIHAMKEESIDLRSLEIEGITVAEILASIGEIFMLEQ